jgi:hypothetical protein
MHIHAPPSHLSLIHLFFAVSFFFLASSPLYTVYVHRILCSFDILLSFFFFLLLSFV